jgi:allantoicase
MNNHNPYAALIAEKINLADDRLGAVGLSCSDEFFAPLQRMLQASEPEWRAGVYDAHGKWMDGWETRRHRGSGHDHCIVQLAAPCSLSLLDIDTRYFTGNYPPHAAVLACRTADKPEAHTVWTEILAHAPLRGNQHNFFAIDSSETWTHLKLNIYPDGGVARLRAYGEVRFDWDGAKSAEPSDLAAALHGGRALCCSDEHYGSMHNLLLPGRGASMADGWETRRRREPGYDWVILRLGHAGQVQRIEIDTAHFKGNFPHQVSIHAALLPAEAPADLQSQSLYWPALLEPQLLRADHVHSFSGELKDLGSISHVRVNIHPDGGLSRVRLFGRPDRITP